MSFHNENMNRCYYSSKTSIVSWVNSFAFMLSSQLQKVEELSSGIVYCKILNMIHPGCVKEQKLSTKPKTSYERFGNLKILQNGFEKIGIRKNIDIQKLSKGKYQENLQLAQWFKGYYSLKLSKNEVLQNSSCPNSMRNSRQIFQQKQQNPGQQLAQVKRWAHTNEVKLDMLEQILKCEENSEVKIQLIKEIMRIQQ